MLTNVTEDDDGVYACATSNAVGNDSFDVRLNVHSKYYKQQSPFKIPELTYV